MPKFNGKESSPGKKGGPEERARQIRSYRTVEEVYEIMKKMLVRCEAAAAKAEAAADRTRPIIVGGSGTAKKGHRMLTPARRTEYLEHRLNGLTATQAARAVGIKMTELKKLRAADPGFAEEEAMIDEERAEKAVAALERAAANGDVRAATWVAEHLAPEKYGPKAQEIKLSGQIDQTHILDTGPALERIAVLAARLEERRALNAGQTDPDVIDVEVLDDGRPD